MMPFLRTLQVLANLRFWTLKKFKDDAILEAPSTARQSTISGSEEVQGC